MASAFKDLFSGIVGGGALVLAGHPLDLIKVRLQTQPKPAPGQPPMFRGALDCAMQTVRKEGVRALYKGVASPLVGVPPIYAIVFGAYGFSKRLLMPQGAVEPSLSVVWWAGCATGVATTVITTPIELVKARLQLQYNRSGEKARYSGFGHCMATVAREEGLRALFRGTVVTLWRDVPGTGAWFLANEVTKRMLIPEGGSKGDLGAGALLFAGGMAGIANWLAIFPLDVIKSRLQTDQSGKYRSGHAGIVQVARELVAEGGVRGLFKGLTPALVRSFPANAACFAATDYTMKLLNKF